MRRFMQTFVLAPQSPKKYYVHNDIFRYQDEVFHDIDMDAETPEDAQGKFIWSNSTSLFSKTTELMPMNVVRLKF